MYSGKVRSRCYGGNLTGDVFGLTLIFLPFEILACFQPSRFVSAVFSLGCVFVARRIVLPLAFGAGSAGEKQTANDAKTRVCSMNRDNKEKRLGIRRERRERGIWRV